MDCARALSGCMTSSRTNTVLERKSGGRGRVGLTGGGGGSRREDRAGIELDDDDEVSLGFFFARRLVVEVGGRSIGIDCTSVFFLFLDIFFEKEGPPTFE